MKITILLHKSHGGFSLSDEVVLKAIEKGMDPDYFEETPNVDGIYRNRDEIDKIPFRSHDLLIEAAREVKEEDVVLSSDARKKVGYDRLFDPVKIVEAEVDLFIESFDGKESLEASHVRTDRFEIDIG